jgi:hypothetical protein
VFVAVCKPSVNDDVYKRSDEDLPFRKFYRCDTVEMVRGDCLGAPLSERFFPKILPASLAVFFQNAAVCPYCNRVRKRRRRSAIGGKADKRMMAVEVCFFGAKRALAKTGGVAVLAVSSFIKATVCGCRSCATSPAPFGATSKAASAVKAAKRRSTNIYRPNAYGSTWPKTFRTP